MVRSWLARKFVTEVPTPSQKKKVTETPRPNGKPNGYNKKEKDEELVPTFLEDRGDEKMTRRTQKKHTE